MKLIKTGTNGQNMETLTEKVETFDISQKQHKK